MRTTQASLLIKRQKLLAILRFPERQLLPQSIFRQRAMLEAALGKHRHLQAGKLFNSARNNLTLQLIQALNVIVGKLDKRNCLRYRDNIGPRIWTEARKSK